MLRRRICIACCSHLRGHLPAAKQKSSFIFVSSKKSQVTSLTRFHFLDVMGVGSCGCQCSGPGIGCASRGLPWQAFPALPSEREQPTLAIQSFQAAAHCDSLPQKIVTQFPLQCTLRGCTSVAGTPSEGREGQHRIDYSDPQPTPCVHWTRNPKHRTCTHFQEANAKDRSHFRHRKARTTNN